MSITKTATTDPKLFVFELKNRSGASIKITNYGGILMSILVPDKNGNLGDVLLGYDTPERYVEDNAAFFGAVCGFIFLHEVMSGRELIGCILMLTAVILAQLPSKHKVKSSK